MASLEIAFLDVRVSLPDSAETVFQQALADFIESGVDYEKEPRIVSGELRIHSLDLHTFLGFLRKEDIDEITLRRVIQSMKAVLEGYEQKTLKKEVRAHYQWCIAAMKNFTIGRHLEG